MNSQTRKINCSFRKKVGHSGCSKASMISFIYQKAIEWLLLLFLKKSKKREWVNKPFLACAMIFCFRQFIEVRLKELVYMGRKELFETPDFQKQHSLSNLFKDYINSVLPKLDPNYDKCMVDNVKCLIDEFNSIDPKSTSFRYPVEKKLKPTLNIPNLNLDNFKEVMDKLSNYFDAQLEVVKLLGNYNEEMATEYASYFYESY